jgi:hypothetical protein
MVVHSQTLRASASEVQAMIEGAVRHGTTMKVEGNYVDSHGQTEIGFGVSRLLGLDLLPRIKQINKVKLYRVESGESDLYPRLTPAMTRPIRWEVIEQNYDQMIKYATAIKQGTASTEAILRRFSEAASHPVHEASGKTLGRPTALDTGQATDVVEAYRSGTAIKALARQHHVAPKTIRRILDSARARGLPDQLDTLAPTGEPAHAPARPDPEVTLDLPGLLADHLNAAGDDAVRQALAAGRTIRRGQGHSVRLTAPLTLHRAALHQSATLAARDAGPAERKAHRVYATRITTAEQQPPPGN